MLVSALEVYRSDARCVSLKLQLPVARRACVVTCVWKPGCVYLPPLDEPWTYPHAAKNTSRVFVREKKR